MIQGDGSVNAPRETLLPGVSTLCVETCLHGRRSVNGERCVARVNKPKERRRVPKDTLALSHHQQFSSTLSTHPTTGIAGEPLERVLVMCTLRYRPGRHAWRVRPTLSVESCVYTTGKTMVMMMMMMMALR